MSITCMGVRRIHKNSSEHANLICRPTTCIVIKWKIIIITNSFSHVGTTQWGSDNLINSFRDCCRWHIITPFTKILTQEEHADCRIFHAAGRHTCTGSVTSYDEVTPRVSTFTSKQLLTSKLLQSNNLHTKYEIPTLLFSRNALSGLKYDTIKALRIKKNEVFGIGNKRRSEMRMA
jgi:hypothetical protein